MMNLFSIFTNKSKKIGLILLNTSIDNLNVLDKLWSNACYKIFLDGFSNEIFKRQLERKYVPDLVIGDFDSIEPSILEKYKLMNEVKVIHDPDQNKTDLDKGINYICTNCSVDSIVIFYKSGGRTDHFFAAVNSLYLAKKYPPAQLSNEIVDKSIPIILLSDVDACILLSEGKHTIDLDNRLVEGTCSLIPIGCPVTVTTKGLKWNLNDTQLKFGQLVSSSNALDSSKYAEIACDNFLLWSMCYKPGLV